MVIGLGVLCGFPENVVLRVAAYYEVASWIHVATLQNFGHCKVSFERSRAGEAELDARAED